MTLSILSPQIAEPVTLSEVKTWLRISHEDEDDLLGDLIGSAREQVEHYTGLALMQREFKERLDQWPEHRVRGCDQAFILARRPLVSVEEVRLYGRDGQVRIWDREHYQVETGEPGRLVAYDGFNLPQPQISLGGIEIQFTAGYGLKAHDVPFGLREAILHLVSQSYGGVETAVSARRGEDGLPKTVADVLNPYRTVRL